MLTMAKVFLAALAVGTVAYFGLKAIGWWVAYREGRKVFKEIEELERMLVLSEATWPKDTLGDKSE